jgi:hypothetical protein
MSRNDVPSAQRDAPSELRQCLLSIVAVELSDHLNRIRQGRIEGLMDGDIAITGEFGEEAVEGIGGRRQSEGADQPRQVAGVATGNPQGSPFPRIRVKHRSAFERLTQKLSSLGR